MSSSTEAHIGWPKSGRSTLLASKDRLICQFLGGIYHGHLTLLKKDDWVVAVVDTKMALCFI